MKTGMSKIIVNRKILINKCNFNWNKIMVIKWLTQALIKIIKIHTQIKILLVDLTLKIISGFKKIKML